MKLRPNIKKTCSAICLKKHNVHWRLLRLKIFIIGIISGVITRWFTSISVERDTAQSLIGCAHDMVNSMLCTFCLADEFVIEVDPRISPGRMIGELAATNYRVILSKLELSYAQSPHVRNCCVLDSSKLGHAKSTTV